MKCMPTRHFGHPSRSRSRTTLFAIARDVAAGVLLQRTTSAVVATLFGFAVVRLGVEMWLRPNYQKAVTGSYSFFGASGRPDGSWTLTDDTVTASGVDVSGGQSRGLSFDLVHQICPNRQPDRDRRIPVRCGSASRTTEFMSCPPPSLTRFDLLRHIRHTHWTCDWCATRGIGLGRPNACPQCGGESWTLEVVPR
jgi:hypothetical protein